MVATDPPLLADLVGLKLAAQNPVADRPLLDFEACRHLLDLEEFGLFGFDGAVEQLNVAGGGDKLADLVAAYSSVADAADALEATGE
jgi:hypothetical protein